jgi:hypothetical protein
MKEAAQRRRETEAARCGGSGEVERVTREAHCQLLPARCGRAARQRRRRAPAAARPLPRASMAPLVSAASSGSGCLS